MHRLNRRGLVVALFAGGAWIVACGGSDSSGPSSSVDAGTDAKTSSGSSGQSSGSPAGPDGSTGDDDSGSSGNTPDGGAPDACVPSTACTTAAGNAGLLDASCNCNACDANGAAPADADTACQATYPGSLCINSSCVTADCRSTTGGTAPGCTGGQICGSTTPNTCGPCTKTEDCTAAAAYGAGYVCSATGACVMGGCGQSGDCDTGATAGDVCVQNQCASCTSDSQCQNDSYYAGQGKTICDTNLKTCVAATCTTAGAACDGSHLCCNTGAVALTCVAGTTYTANGNNQSCCSASDCQNVHGFTSCVNYQCSACPAVTDGNYYVDPVNGTDDGSSGSNGAGCRFKTLAHALSVANAASGTKTVYLIGDDDPTTNKAEKSFPLNIPANVTLVGYDATASAKTARKVLIPAGSDGFAMSKSNSGLSYISIDGVNGNTTVASMRYGTGITIAGSPNASPTGIALDHVSVTNSLDAGIVIGGSVGAVQEGATVTFGGGMSVTNAGFTAGTLANGNQGASPASGVSVLGSALLTINGGADASSFSNNSQHGIEVTQTAGLTINGTVVAGNGDYTTSSVVALNNTVAGLLVGQTPTGASTQAATWTAMPTCAITGFVTANATNGNGIRIQGGSKVKMRGSVSYGNAGDGVHIETGGSNTTLPADANYIGAIDLGTAASAGAAASPGANVLQVPYGNVGATYNKGAGICLAIAATAVNGATLSAYGNKLVGTDNTAADCSTTAATVAHSTLCRSVAGAPASVGVTPAKNNTNTVDVSQCK